LRGLAPKRLTMPSVGISMWGILEGEGVVKRIPPALVKEFLGLPNLLTYARIVAIPFTVFFLMLSEKAVTGQDGRWYGFLALLLFSLAAVTDYLDGWIARAYQQHSLVGKFMDPIADKMVVLATLVTLVELRVIEAWIVVLILLREVAITGLRALATAEQLTIEVSEMGKLKTVFQLCGIVALLFHCAFAELLPPLPLDAQMLGKILIVISLFFSLISASFYFTKFVRAVVAKYEERQGKK